MVKVYNPRKIFAIKAENEKRIKKLCPSITNDSGIYVFYRTDENGIKHAYVGQAVHLLQRAAEHLSGYQHIDLSIKKYGLFDKGKNPYGYDVFPISCAIEELNDAEQYWIKYYADLGYQLKNATTGSQGEGKKSLTDHGRGGYMKGKREGAEKALREIGEAIRKYTKGLESKGGALADRKTAELKEKLGGEKG